MLKTLEFNLFLLCQNIKLGLFVAHHKIFFKISVIFLKFYLFNEDFDAKELFLFCHVIRYSFQNRHKICALVKWVRFRFAPRKLAGVLSTLKCFRAGGFGIVQACRQL